MRRLEAHGDEFKQAPVFKINTLRTLVIGKSKEYFDLWEADKDRKDPSKVVRGLVDQGKGLLKKEKAV